jgi:VCBS repeat-containing protein
MEAKLVESATVSETGNVINDVTNGKLYIVGGADEAYVKSITIGSKTYTYDGTSISDGSTAIGSGSVMEVVTTLRKDGSTPIGSSIVFDFATGEYTYTINSTLGGVQYNESFDVVITDNDGDTVTKTLSFDVNTNSAPVAADDTGSVDEDATVIVAASGVLVNDTDANADALSVSDVRTGDESGSGTAGTVGSALVGTYGTLTLNANGSYTYVADQAAADALSGTQTATDIFTYTVSDGKGGTDTAQLSITVNGQDEIQPLTLKNDIVKQTEFYDADALKNGGDGSITTNLVITLDVSGSMQTSSDPALNRLDIAKSSLVKVIENYEKQGGTEVNLTLFGKTSKNIGWMSSADAKTYIDGLSISSGSVKTGSTTITGLSSSGTNYEGAINDTTGISFDGKSADRTLAFYISDGDPTIEVKSDGTLSSLTTSNVLNSIDGTSGATAGVSIGGTTYGRVDQAYYDMWSSFTNNLTNGIDTSTVGIGSGLSDDGKKYLNMLAGAYGGEALFVGDNADQLLAGLIPDQEITGNIMNHVEASSAVTIESVTVGGTIYTADVSDVAIDGKGKLSIDLTTGEYSYKVKSTEFDTDTKQSFGVKVSDASSTVLEFDVDMHVLTFRPTISGTAGDDELFYNPTAVEIDGGGGTDTLFFGNTDIDLSGIDAIKNVEKLDLSGNGNQILSGLTLDQVFDMSGTGGSSRILTIDGDAGDTVGAVEKTGWTKNSASSDATHNIYEYQKGSDVVTLKIDNDLTNTTGLA